MRHRVASFLALLAAGLAAAGALGGCGGSAHPAPAPPQQPAAERLWVENADRFVSTLNSDIGLTTGGGPTIADARRTMTNTDGIYTLLVAYSLFGDCGPALAAVGTPGPPAGRTLATLVAACTRLEHASALFQQAMTRHEPSVLLAATRASLAAAPLLARARLELAALGHA